MSKVMFNELMAKHGARDVADTTVFSVKLSKKKKEESKVALAAALANERMSIKAEEKMRASILQLRFQIEDYLKDAEFDKRKTFGYFLKSYINKLEIKQVDFANDINIKAAQLSQYINNHRAPTQDIIIRLELHSESIIPATDWYMLVEMKNLHDLKTNKTLRKEQRLFVKNEMALT